MPSPAAGRGRVYQLSCKEETPGARGLPKVAVSEARVSRQGLVGDFNRYRHEERHDDPGMAILLLPIETIEELNREGWPVHPGDLGENVTTSGIPYDGFAPGTRLRVGGSRLEVTKACDPCDNLYQLPYVGTERGPEFLRTMVGRRGWYARVLDDGPVRRGDPIETESDPGA